MIDYLYHYYEKLTGPFRSLSGLPIGEAQSLLNGIKVDNELMAAHRHDGYLERRHELETVAREIAVQGADRSRLGAQPSSLQVAPTWISAVCRYDIHSRSCNAWRIGCRTACSREVSV